MRDTSAIRDRTEAEDDVGAVLARAKELLHYDPETGDFIWVKPPRRGVSAGWIAGKITPHGDRVLGFDGRMFRAHRMAWLFVHGRWPKGDIDHANGNPADNRIGNLRECTRAENLGNTKRPANNTTGYKGVTFRQGKYIAQIGGTKNGRRYNTLLGAFDDPVAAHQAYVRAATARRGAFARAG